MDNSSRHVRRSIGVGCALVMSLATGYTIAGPAHGAARAAAPGNNGTLKIHERGTPSGTPSNDPQVCVFNVEGFGFDPGQTGTLRFSVQGGDGPTGVPAGPFPFGPTDAKGFYATRYFQLQPGHYKATLYGKPGPKGKQPEVKAKSSVFKVQCAATPSPSPTPSRRKPSPSPTPAKSIPSQSPVAPSPSPSQSSPSVPPSVAPSSVAPSSSAAGSSAAPSPSVLSGGATRGTQPKTKTRTTTKKKSARSSANQGRGVTGAVLAHTGAMTWIALVGLSLLGVGVALLTAVRRRRAA